MLRSLAQASHRIAFRRLVQLSLKAALMSCDFPYAVVFFFDISTSGGTLEIKDRSLFMRERGLAGIWEAPF